MVSSDRELQSTLPLLDECFRAASRRLRTRLMNRTGTDTPVRAGTLRLLTMGEVLDAAEVKEAALWSAFTIERVNLGGFTVIERQLLDRLVGRMFGEGEPVSTAPWARRPPTEVELRVGTRICEELYLAIEANWPGKTPIRLLSRRASPQRHGIMEVSATAPMLTASLEVGPAEDPFGLVTLAMPAMVLRAASGAPEIEAPARPPAARTPTWERLWPVKVEMVVELTRVSTTLGKLQDLKPGDEIPLGAVLDAAGVVNGQIAVYGEAGESAGQRSFRVKRRSLES
jgi:flagellar motor switch protein FliM